jgi:hypothetical protein
MIFDNNKLDKININNKTKNIFINIEIRYFE